MDAFDDGVGRDDNVFAECFENGRIVGQPKRARIGGQRLEVARDQESSPDAGAPGAVILELRFRSSQTIAATSDANFEIKGALANYCF